jgi:hypothetical protein
MAVIATSVLGGVLICVLVAGCVLTVAPALGTSIKIVADSGGQVRDVAHESWWSSEKFRVYLAPGVADSEGPDVACRIVWPALRGSQFEKTPFEVYGNAGNVVADNRTPCP